MGNIGSHGGSTVQHPPIEDDKKWSHSFPRTPPKTFQQHKVLPDRDGALKLRPTNNGEILHSGGTLSGRQHQHRLSFEDKNFQGGFRSNNISPNYPNQYHQQNNGTFMPSPNDLLHKPNIHKFSNIDQKYHKGAYMQRRDQMKRFGSEPDLRDASTRTLDIPDKLKGRKKYRAPPPPSCSIDKSTPSGWNDRPSTNDPNRKARLFKTQAETKKKSSPVNNRRFVDLDLEMKSPLNQNEVEMRKKHLILSPVQKCNSLPEFQAELKKATQKFRSSKLLDEQEEDSGWDNVIDWIKKDHFTSEDTSSKPAHQNSRLGEENNIIDESNETKQIPEDVYPEERRRISQSKPINEDRRQLKEMRQRPTNDKFGIKEERRRSNEENQPNRNTKEDAEIIKSRLKTLDHNINKKEILLKNLSKLEENDSTPGHEIKDPSSLDKKPKDTPKIFYFGMEDTSYTNNNSIDKFISNFQTQAFPFNSSGSDISSEIDIDDGHVSGNDGIALQLRPILPKKQFDIPRFSPASAWKMLSAIESNQDPSSASNDDITILMEDCIENQPVPIRQDGPRSSHDKSGDSGISGDAGPPAFDESPKALVLNSQKLRIHSNFRQTGMPWTPQQDLGDDSSIEEGLTHSSVLVYNSSTPRFSPRPHIFSLSLPRDNHLTAYSADKSEFPGSTGLDKLKRSFSGVLHSIGSTNTTGKKDSYQSNVNPEQNNNWFLSKSAPNSLNNDFSSLKLKPRKNEFQEEQVGNHTIPNTGRLMYLPKLDEYSRDSKERTRCYEGNSRSRHRSRSADRTRMAAKLSVFSKSCENISGEVKSSSEPEDLQDPPKFEDKWKSKKHRRFTFQSTVRQIERKRLAEKLSREAEKKEKQRLREFEAMQKVEEEFQKKRAKEKASIRQQLRLFSIDSTSWSNLPLDKESDMIRQEPDGAVSSSPSSTLLKDGYKVKGRKSGKYSPSSNSSEETKTKVTSTKVLSEYRQPQREYKDFKGRYNGESIEPKQTVHPQVTYRIPMASGYQSSNNGTSANYRKDFAHGKKNSKSGDSTYSEDSQSNLANHSPRMCKNKSTPLTRL